MAFSKLLLLSAAIGHAAALSFGHERVRREVSPEWAQQWEQVADVVPNPPPHKVFVEWPNNVRVEPNATISTGLNLGRPRLIWDAEPGALYTVMILDGWSDRVLPKTIMFWVVTNIAGNAVDQGNEVIEYLTPFAIAPQENYRLQIILAPITCLKVVILLLALLMKAPYGFAALFQ